MQLSSREKTFVWVALLALLVMGVHRLMVPSLRRLEVLERVVPEKGRTLQALSAHAREYDRLQQEIASMRQKISGGQGARVLSKLESMAIDSGLKVSQMTRSNSHLHDRYEETQVELRVEGASLEEIVRLLQKVQSPETHLSVRSLQLRQSRANPSRLDATVRVSTLSLPEEG